MGWSPDQSRNGRLSKKLSDGLTNGLPAGPGQPPPCCSRSTCRHRVAISVITVTLFCCAKITNKQDCSHKLLPFHAKLYSCPPPFPLLINSGHGQTYRNIFDHGWFYFC